MANFPQFVSPMLTEVTSQPGQGLDAFDVSGWCPIVTVDPKASDGIILVDRKVMESTESDRDLSRSPMGEHKPIHLADPTTVSYETYERASPMDSYAKVKAARAQDPLQYRARIARHLAQVAHQKYYSDVATLFTTAANWNNTSTLAGLTGGSGAKVSVPGTSDLITDLQVAVEAYQNANGQMDPKHCVLNRQVLQYASRTTALRNALPDNVYQREGFKSIVQHIENVTGMTVHVQTAAQNNSLIWTDAIILLPDHNVNSVMMDNGAQIDPCAGVIIHEDFSSFAPGDFYIKEWDRPDGNVVNLACVKSYDVAVVDADAAYLLTDCI